MWRPSPADHQDLPLSHREVLRVTVTIIGFAKGQYELAGGSFFTSRGYWGNCWGYPYDWQDVDFAQVEYASWCNLFCRAQFPARL